MKKYIFSLFILLFSSSSFSLMTKSIYSLDDRELVTLSSSPELKNLAKSIALIYFQDDLIQKDDNLEYSVLLAPLLTVKPPIGRNYCSSEKFSDHHSYKRACTGFLVADDILVTAGHCFKTLNDCEVKKISFEITSDKELDRFFKISKDNIFSCTKILANAYDPDDTLMDYSIIKLDRKTNRPFLKLSETKPLSTETNVFMLGHPLGLPLTLSRNGKILENSNDIYFKASLDSFHGNSGSPVFNSLTNEVEGVMVRGEIDEEYDTNLKCNKYAGYSEEDSTRGEGITRIGHLIPLIKKFINE